MEKIVPIARLCGSGGLVRKFHVPAHFRAFPSVASIQAVGRLFSGAWYGGVETCPYVAGTRFGSWRPWGRILFFADTTGHIRTLGSRLCGSGGWVRKFLVSRSFPLISERCLHSGGGRLFAGAWDGGVETCPYVAGTRFGSWRPWGRILFFADTTGHIRTLGSRLCGVCCKLVGLVWWDMGPSPRWRALLHFSSIWGFVAGSITALAGSAGRRGGRCPGLWVHHRAGGNCDAHRRVTVSP